MGEGMRETWTTEEFGSSHAGAVGVLLADGTVPDPVYFDSASGPGGQAVAQWSVYDGRETHVPRAAVLRAVCSCGWAGPEHRLDWEAIGEQDLDDGGEDQAEACLNDWDGHTSQVEARAVPLPETVSTLLERLEEEIDKLTKSSPVAAVRAARRLEVVAERVGYWAARGTASDLDTAQAAVHLGLDEGSARKLMARFGGWSPYR
ncbi:hypothetical protein M8Z33_32345 [Streptomyces sp. ZAF1911]|uniref:hypothetical protein n=1 Tax=unclassified Streptomyces TaxID=2593676 RepID=UPI00237AB204|nr:hypothetical protein [Streptomyces sp. ZAF1911]MDD9381261.1 hypothetical protein [Streptomyces sp. ZAF1911]